MCKGLVDKTLVSLASQISEKDKNNHSTLSQLGDAYIVELKVLYYKKMSPLYNTFIFLLYNATNISGSRCLRHTSPGNLPRLALKADATSRFKVSERLTKLLTTIYLHCLYTYSCKTWQYQLPYILTTSLQFPSCKWRQHERRSCV